MSRAEWRNVLLLALVIVAVTSIPYLLAWQNQAEDWRFTGFLFGVEDGNSYLGKMRLGARGIWDFFLFYTPEAHNGVSLVFLPYILPGQIVGRLIPETDPALTLALILTFHLMRVVFDMLLVVIVYRFSAAFLSQPRDRLAATILALLGGGLGWLLSFTQDTLPPDLYIPEGFGFLILFGLPHLALARAALLAGFLALLRSLPKTPTQLKPSAKEWRWLLLAALCWLVVGLSVPFYFVVIYCILGAWGLAAWLKTRHFPQALFMRAVIAAGITFPLFLFYAFSFAQNPAFAVWSAQNSLPSPEPLQYLLAYLPLGLLALLGIRAVWRQPGIRTALIIGWVLIVPILVYLPINVQRRLSEAVIVPLAILAAAGLGVLAERGVPWLVRAALVIVISLTSALLLLGGLLAAASPGTPLFRPADEIAALDWLNRNSHPDEIALSAVETGNVIPAWTHLRPYMGHGPETLFWQDKTAQVKQFYAGGMSTEEIAAFFANPCEPGFSCSGSIRYVMFGPLERALASDDNPAWAAGLSMIYNHNGYRIYETMP